MLGSKPCTPPWISSLTSNVRSGWHIKACLRSSMQCWTWEGKDIFGISSSSIILDSFFARYSAQYPFRIPSYPGLLLIMGIICEARSNTKQCNWWNTEKVDRWGAMVGWLKNPPWGGNISSHTSLASSETSPKVLSKAKTLEKLLTIMSLAKDSWNLFRPQIFTSELHLFVSRPPTSNETKATDKGNCKY